MNKIKYVQLTYNPTSGHMTRRWCCDFNAKIETWLAVISPYLKICQRGEYTMISET